mgnify:FL=1
MLGQIISVEENTVILKLNIDLTKFQSIINLFAILEESEKRFIGEIVDVKDGNAYIHLLGELKEDRFVPGVSRKPSFGASVKLVSKERMPMIMSVGQYQEDKHLLLGKSVVYEDIDISVDINSFFSNHFAIFGSTGSGKSCSVARIFQNLFEKKNSIPYRASIFIFDAYGEYHQAFSKLHEITPELNFKAYTTNLKFGDSEILRIPLWLMDVDDIAILLGAEKASQLPILEKALKFITVFAQEEDVVIKYKNDVIARALLDILSSGRAPAQIRDQVTSVLTNYHTKDLNLETTIYQPGYSRPLKQCLFIDATGKIRDMELLINFLNTFLDDNLELKLPDGTFKYNLKDLASAFDFAVISEGALLSEKVFDDVNLLKVRLHTMANGETSTYFDYPEFITKEQYIRNLLTAPNGRKAQIVNFNINYIDDRLAKTITKVYSHLLFDYCKENRNRGTLPFHIVLEEAHRYVQNDSDVSLIGYNIFERIAKEGRKYGVVLGLISQRPSELSETTLSQCNNFLVFKMLHPRDISYIRDMVPNVTEEIMKKIRVLQPGSCIAFGLAFKIPVIIQFKMPDPTPSSDSCDVSRVWFVNRNQ